MCLNLERNIKQHHNELRESHKELKDKQDKVVDENLEQTKILNRIEERYQTQVDVAQKMKKRHSPKINGSWVPYGRCNNCYDCSHYCINYCVITLRRWT